MRSAFLLPNNQKKHFQYYVYDQVVGNAVAYDATLQGGVFNQSNVYTIPASQINRLTLQNKFGIVFIFHSLYLEYYRTSGTKEFITSTCNLLHHIIHTSIQVYHQALSVRHLQKPLMRS